MEERGGKERMILDNEKLAYYSLGKINKEFLFDEDMKQIALMGLVKAVNTFDDTKGYTFSTYAMVVIRNTVLMHLRDDGKIPKCASLDVAICEDDDGNDATLANLITSDADTERDAMIAADIERMMEAIEKLSEKEREVISVRYGIGKPHALTQLQAAEMLGMSQANVCRIAKKALKKLKKLMEG